MQEITIISYVGYKSLQPQAKLFNHRNIGNSTDPRWQWQATVMGTQSASRLVGDLGKPTRRPIRAPKPEYLMSLNADFCMLMVCFLDLRDHRYQSP